VSKKRGGRVSLCVSSYGKGPRKKPPQKGGQTKRGPPKKPPKSPREKGVKTREKIGEIGGPKTRKELFSPKNLPQNTPGIYPGMKKRGTTNISQKKGGNLEIQFGKIKYLKNWFNLNQQGGS